ncbi:allantoicase [alpha proteobacterium U9-1i]|nr:allantoicase [alpha proteobacterium U9-1i]
MMSESQPGAPAGLIDLLQPRLGSEAVFANDDFFAPKERLINPEEPVFVPGKYDENGKWMDGWESRRKRAPGHDFCIVRLGRPGIVHALDVDTRNFTGNYPPRASVDCLVSDARVPGEDAAWRPLVEMMDLRGDSRHAIEVPSPQFVTHLRLNIFPDGGVARLRAYGRVTPPWRGEKPNTRVDLGAMENGAVPIYANNEHYGRLANITAPGAASNMGDGWETRRRREPGYDWGILELASPGTIDEIIVDTCFFKGNFPDRCFIQAAPMRDLSREALIAESEDWAIILPEQKLTANAQHVFKEILPHQAVAYVRLNILPDGGVARLRLFGRVA